MTELSPAAQAVLNAAMLYEINHECYSREIAVAALRAAADQMGSYQSKKFLYSIADAMKLQEIADELEQCTDPEGDYLDDNALSINRRAQLITESTIRRALEQLDD